MSLHSRVLQRALDYDKALLATHPGFNHAVVIRHEDGSYFFLNNAFLKLYNGPDKKPWLLCFTEHHGVHVWHTEDLVDYAELKVGDESKIEVIT